MRKQDASLNLDDVEEYKADVEKDCTLRLASNLLTNTSPFDALVSTKAIRSNPYVFNTVLKGVDGGKSLLPVTHPKESGRCWIFATTNMLRYSLMPTLDLDKFQFSQSYLHFYDKMERANFFLEQMIELKDEPLDSPVVRLLNQRVMSDGGQFTLARNLLRKYGALPHDLFPDTYSASSTPRMIVLLASKMREYGLVLRSSPKPHQLKAGFMKEIYGILTICLGVPPMANERIVWNYVDKKGESRQWKGTPLDLYALCPLDDRFTLINDPRHKYGKLYTIKRFGNVIGEPVLYVNAPMDVLEPAVVQSIKADIPVYFSCDIFKSTDDASGVMDLSIRPLEEAFGVKLNISKADRLRTIDGSPAHAMVITGVHVEDGKPVRYRVENSFGEGAGNGGVDVMTSAWFWEHTYKVILPKSMIGEEWVKVLEQDPVEWEEWDPLFNPFPQ